MKKLRIALTLLFALSCSLFLFACGEKDVSDLEFSGQKLTFIEGEEFSVGDLKVECYYQGVDDPVVLKDSEYTVDASKYDKNNAGEYTITITPKNQPSGHEPYSESYSVTVDHNWQATDNGRACTCGAKEFTYDNLTSTVRTVGWNNVATYEAGANPYVNAKAPAAGEYHVSLGTLVQGQSLTVTMEILSADTGNGYNTPLMGIRDGAVGTIPREDKYVIGGGPAGAFATPATGSKDTGSTAGEADVNSTEWIVYSSGDTWGSTNMQPVDGKNAIDVIKWDYQMNGIFLITHTLSPADGSRERTLRYTVKVPDSGYELVAYGEKTDYMITKAVLVENRAIDAFTATDPTNTVQAEGKMFDKTGIKTNVTFTKGNPITGEGEKAVGNFYAMVGTGEEARAVNLGSNALSADMHDFYVEFGGKTAALNVTVAPTQIKGASAVTVNVNGTPFEAPNAVYDYQLNAAKTGTDLVVTGEAAALTPAQKTAVGGSATHFVAFRMLGFKEGAFDGATADNASVTVNAVAGEGGLTNVDVVVPFSGKPANFNITLTKEGTTVATVLVDLSGLKASASVSAEVTSSEFYLDKGGIFTVEYKALGGSFSGNINDYMLAVASRRPKVSEIATKGDKAPEGVTDFTTGYKVSANFYIVSATPNGDTLTVKYWVKAPDLGNLSETNSSQTVELRNADGDTVASAVLWFDYRISANSNQYGVYGIGDGVYVRSAGASLYVFKLFETADVRDGISFDASLNIQNDKATSYNLGVVLSKGVAAVKDENVVSLGSNVKLVSLGAVNDNSDTDRGAMLLMDVKLSTLGIRADKNSKEAVYYFTANEDLNNPASSYTVYKVEADDITAIEKTSANSGNLSIRQAGNCVLDEIQSYTYTDGGSTFYYGARITAAKRGYHEWQAGSAANVDTCPACGYVRTLVDGVYSILPGTSEQVENTMVDGWWTGTLGSKKVSGDFAVQYTWQNIRDNNYSDVVIQLYAPTGTDGASQYWNATVFETNRAVAEDGTVTPATAMSTGWGDLNTGTSVTAFLDGEQVWDSANPKAYDANALPHLGLKDNLFRGNYTMTLIRSGGTFWAIVELERTNGTSDQEIAATEQVTAHYTVIYKMRNITPSDMTVELAGNPYWIDNVTVKVGNAQAYAGVYTKDGKQQDLAFGSFEYVENTDTDKDAWFDAALGSKKVSGDFAVQYTWQNIRDNNYTDVVVQLYNEAAEYWNATILETNRAVAEDGTVTPATALNAGWGALNIGTTVTAFLDGEQVWNSANPAGYDANALPHLGMTDSLFRGYYTMTYVRIGTTLTVTVDFVRMGKDGELSEEKIELDEKELAHYVVTYTMENFTTADLTVEITGNPYWIDNLNVSASPEWTPVVTRS